MREFLKGLELDQETIDTIMAEYGKNVTMFKEQLDEYKSQVSDYEGIIEQLNEKIDSDNKSLENLQTLTNENKDLKTQLQMSDSNVKKEFMKFVTSEISSRVNDDTDFATALNDYKKENPQYFGDTVVKKVQTSPSLNAGGTQPQSTNEIMNDILRGAVND